MAKFFGSSFVEGEVRMIMDFTAATIVHGQFDDAVQDAGRQGNAYIDTYDPAQDALTWSDTPEDESADEDGFNVDIYDETCVDDEDWEIAERGAFQHVFWLSLIRV